jgi:hypothetical protein
MERKVNLRLRIILKALLAGAIRVTRSCSRAVDMGTSIPSEGGLSNGYLRLRVQERDVSMTPALRVYLGHRTRQRVLLGLRAIPVDLQACPC